jgi:hypothetical protein
MFGDDYEGEIRCSFCDEPNTCKHLVAAIDFENAALDGYLSNHVEDLGQLVEGFFQQLVASRGEAVDWEHASEFSDIWEDYLLRRQDPEETPLDSGLLIGLIDSLLQNTDAIAERSDAVVAYFDRRPKQAHEAVVRQIHKACQQAKGEA